MSVRIDGDLDFQRWYYEKYQDISPIVSHEIYGEYLDYKEQQKIEFRDFCLKVGVVVLIVLIIIFDMNIFMRFFI